MNDTEHSRVLERQLDDALKRLSQLERKVETMRGNINANFDAHTGVLSALHTEFRSKRQFNFRQGIDVARD